MLKIERLESQIIYSFGSNKTKRAQTGWPKSTMVTYAWGRRTFVLHYL